MSVQFRFEGLEELKRELRNLPDALTAEASHIIEAAANAAAFEVRRSYPVHTGNLRDHVFVTPFLNGRFAYGLVVKSAAKHAWIFEYGTQARHYYTRKGVRHETGEGPPGRVFVPAMIRWRRKMYQQLKDMIARHGMGVSGDVAA